MVSRLLELFLKVAIFIATFISIIILSTYLYLLSELPRVDNVDQSKLQIPLKIYTSDEKLIGEFGEKKSGLTPIGQLFTAVKSLRPGRLWLIMVRTAALG